MAAERIRKKKVTKTEHKRWTNEDKAYLAENFGIKSVAEMARDLGRTPMSVRLYIHQHRLVPHGQKTVKRNVLVELLGPENPFEDVAEDAYYYDAVRWALDAGVTAGTSANPPHRSRP